MTRCRAPTGKCRHGGLLSEAARQLTSPGLVFAEIVIFILLLALAFAYAWRKGVFDWRV